MGTRVRDLRVARRLSQAELAVRLGISQPQLSQVERGRASLTAERFLRVLRLFNVGVDHFDVADRDRSPLQNALIRHGATHLAEDDSPVPTELDRPIDVVWQVLRDPSSPRHVTALAPVLVASAARIALPELASRLAREGRSARLGWILASLPGAIDAAGPSARLADQREARRAVLLAQLALDSNLLAPPEPTHPLDLLDPDIRTKTTLEQVFASASPEARRWRVATSIRTSDFAEALEAARASRR